MLKTLNIKNFIIIKEEKLDFKDGLNIITGETGSGKSIIIDALSVALGMRAGADMVKKDEKKALIEATFYFKDTEIEMINEFLSYNELDQFGNELIIRREISAKSGSRAFINDTPVTIQQIKEISSLLTHFHGQHDNRILLDNESHIDILDAVGDYQKEKNKYIEIYSELGSKINKLKQLKAKENELKQKIEFQKFQLDEIEKINPNENEDNDIENELNILENSEFLKNTTSDTFSKLYGEDNSIYNQLTEVEELLKQICRIDKSFENYLAELHSAIITIKEVAIYSNDYSEEIDFSSEKIEELRNRLVSINRLKKKYGTISQIIETKNNLSKDLSLAENFDKELEILEKEIHELEINLGEAAEKLSIKRRQHGKEFSSQINNTLLNLGINYPAFEVRSSFIETKNDSELKAKIKNKYYSAFNTGIDKLEFYVSTNKGELPAPIANVASGGEISRIMLAIKSIKPSREASSLLPTLIFDEIDSGISGRIARKVGLQLKELSNNYQLISITHLPQIASLGDINFSVSKEENNEGTISKVKIIEGNELIDEIAKMISGEEISESALKSAKDLILK